MLLDVDFPLDVESLGVAVLTRTPGLHRSVDDNLRLLVQALASRRGKAHSQVPSLPYQVGLYACGVFMCTRVPLLPFSVLTRALSHAPGLLCCGDSTFPGIGLPAVAASGAVAANSLVSPWKHWQMLDSINA